MAASPRWGAAVAAWMLMMLAETGNAAVRELFIAPVVGALRARQLGVLIGSVIVVLIAWACWRWIRAASAPAQFTVGGLWVALTLAFEFSVGRAMGLSWSRLFADYDPLQGGFMCLGLAVMFMAPGWVAKWRGKNTI